MPRVNGRTGELVLRIIYDGSPEAGKTTSLMHLASTISLQRRGTLASPGTVGQRTAFFDWLDFAGGFVDGRRVRCEVVTVPGQPSLLHRRRYLLRNADAVVFVADSREGAIAENRANLATTRDILAVQDLPVPAGLIVQANKQDLEGALDPGELATDLELAGSVAVIPSVAVNGHGVMQTFVLAARLATDRLRALMAMENGHVLPVSEETPEALHAALQELRASTPSSASDSIGASLFATPRDSHPRQVGSEPSHTAADGLPLTRRHTERSHEPGGARRRNRRPAGRRLSIRSGSEIGAGHLWPPVNGRSMLANAAAGDLFLPPLLAPWAPEHATEVRTDNGWVFHTADRWLLDDESAGRKQLLTLVQRQLACGDLLPDNRAFFVCEEADGKWRNWMLTKPSATLSEAFLLAMSRRDEVGVLHVLDRARTAVHHLADVRPAAFPSIGVDDITVEGGRPALLRLPEPEDRPPGMTRSLGRELLDRAADHGATAEDLDWLLSIGFGHDA